MSYCNVCCLHINIQVNKMYMRNLILFLKICTLNNVNKPILGNHRSNITTATLPVYFVMLQLFIGDYGKLGHGNTLMQKVPKIIQGPFRNKVKIWFLVHLLLIFLLVERLYFVWGFKNGSHNEFLISWLLILSFLPF